MTLVGKILVVVIMAFSLLFLGISTVVFSTSRNWKDAAAAEKKKVNDLQSKLKDTQAAKDAAEKGLKDAQASFEAQAKQLSDRAQSLEEQTKRDLSQITDVRGQLAKANQSAKSALDEVEAKRNETALLRTQKSAVEKQANDFKLRQAELNDKIRELERVLDTATKNNSDLRERVAKFSSRLRQSGISDDISEMKGVESPPPVTGQVKRVDPSNRRIEISIGSDDGLVLGHELNIFRLDPRPEYLGKFQVIAVEPDQAVGKVVGKTYQGKKIKEGDIVSSTIRPRF